VAFARGRQAFGQFNGKFQSISNRIADMNETAVAQLIQRNIIMRLMGL
jgi:hypothetical protein